MDITIYSKYENETGTLFYNHALKKNQSQDNYQPHFHDLTEIIFFKSGNISYFIDGKRYKLKKDMLVLTRPANIHDIEVDGDEEYERYNILIDEKSLPFDIYKKIPLNIDVIDFEKNTHISSIFKKMDYYCNVLEKKDLENVLRNLTEEVLYNIIIESSNVSKSTSTTNPIISKAMDYIENNLMTLSGVDEIANELYVTKSHLHHLFIKHLNIPPKKYITIKRLSAAQREIYLGGKPTEICTKCGFSDYSSFYRAYKNYFDRPPSDIGSTRYIGLNSDELLKNKANKHR